MQTVVGIKCMRIALWLQFSQDHNNPTELWSNVARLLQPNLFYPAVRFKNLKKFWVLLFGQSSEWWVGLCKSQRNALTHLRPLAIPTRQERDSFKQNKSLKLKNFVLLPEATRMSREELSPGLSWLHFRINPELASWLASVLS